MRILPSGGTALLLELDDLQDMRDWHAALSQAALPGVVDLVPAARTLLVVVDPHTAPDVGPDPGAPPAVPHARVALTHVLDALAHRLRAMQPPRGRRPDGADAAVLEVPVVYDGDDLAEVARLQGCDELELVRRHTRETWTVAFCGFAPGFGYLVPDGDPWDVPRRAVPRTRVPTGAVGLAGPYTGVYPRASPGGWQLIGRTPLELFDVTRDPPALLVPGRRVRFHDVTGASAGVRRVTDAEAAEGIGREQGSASAPVKAGGALGGDGPHEPAACPSGSTGAPAAGGTGRERGSASAPAKAGDALGGDDPHEPAARPSGSTGAPAEAPADVLGEAGPRATTSSAPTQVAPGTSTGGLDRLAGQASTGAASTGAASADRELIDTGVSGSPLAGLAVADPVSTRPALTVVAGGLSTTLQDDGRPGLGNVGVSRSGAADRSSYALANRLVGNRSGAPALEVTAGGLVLRAEREVLVAVTGAPCIGAPDNACVRLRAGDQLRLGLPVRGLRTYVGVRGGLAAPEVLHSCSTDSLSGLGPEPLQAGDVLALADAATDLPPVDVAPRAPVGVGVGEALAVRVTPGPRADWFRHDAWQVLTDATYVVTSDSNRVGVRLDGPRLERAVDAELPSEGLVRGAVQVPPSGLPLVFLADHPITGGYPVIANVVDDDVDALAQLRPGDRLRLRPT